MPPVKSSIVALDRRVTVTEQVVQHIQKELAQLNKNFEKLTEAMQRQTEMNEKINVFIAQQANINNQLNKLAGDLIVHEEKDLTHHERVEREFDEMKINLLKGLADGYVSKDRFKFVEKLAYGAATVAGSAIGYGVLKLLFT